MSQVALMQPSKAKGQHYGSLLLQPILRHAGRGSLQVPLPSYTQVEWNLSYQLNPMYPRIPRTQAFLLVATLQPTTTRTT